jgi:hypothetical protein
MKLLLPLILIAIGVSGCGLIFEKSLKNESVEIVSPMDSLQSNTYVQTFLWEVLDGATKYRVQIAKPSFQMITGMVLDTTISINSLTYNLNPGVYQWRVRAENSGTETPFTTRNIEILEADFQLTQVQLKAPVSNLVYYTNPMSYSWASLFNATEYEIEWDTITGNFSNPLYKTTTTNTTITYSLPERGFYQWRVRAKNAAAEFSNYSVIRPLKYDLSSPVLIAPTDKYAGNLPITLSWGSVTGAVSYELYLTDTVMVNPDPNSFPRRNIITNSTTIVLLPPNKDYYWQVTAVDVNGYKSIASSRRRFRINL